MAKNIRLRRKIIGEIELRLNYLRGLTADRLMDFLLRGIKNSPVGYAGFRTKKDLRTYLRGSVFGTKTKAIPEPRFDERAVLSVVGKSVSLCYRALPAGKVRIFLFPTFSEFVAKKMSGTTGFAPWKGTILIFIYPGSRSWKRALPKTIAHEFNHAAILKYRKWNTLLDSMIFEGLAEHFREEVVGGGKAPLVKALPVSKSKATLSRLRNKLSSTSRDLYRAVFFGGKTFPLWTGYTIGYRIVGEYLKKHRGVSWRALVKTPAQEIFDQSGL